MATTIYKSGSIHLIDGTEIHITPLKIKYLRPFMDVFETIESSVDEDERLATVLECVRIAMQQYYPQIKTIDQLEDKILDLSAGISLGGSDDDKDSKSNSNDKSDGNTWKKTDLAALESEVFLLGIWKDYEELESSMSMPELSATLNAKREAEYAEKKFLAAMQGVDLDEQSGRKAEDPWEAMKARVFSRGQAQDSNDVLALQGLNAAKQGFGIGMGLDYERIG
jgi:hypothetical protein